MIPFCSYHNTDGNMLSCQNYRLTIHRTQFPMWKVMQLGENFEDVDFNTVELAKSNCITYAVPRYDDNLT